MDRACKKKSYDSAFNTKRLILRTQFLITSPTRKKRRGGGGAVGGGGGKIHFFEWRFYCRCRRGCLSPSCFSFSSPRLDNKAPVNMYVGYKCLNSKWENDVNHDRWQWPTILDGPHTRTVVVTSDPHKTNEYIKILQYTMWMCHLNYL